MQEEHPYFNNYANYYFTYEFDCAYQKFTDELNETIKVKFSWFCAFCYCYVAYAIFFVVTVIVLDDGSSNGCLLTEGVIIKQLKSKM